jgi:hypothetical protein
LEHAFKTQVLINHGRGNTRSNFIGRGKNSNRGGRTIPSNTSENWSGRGNNKVSTQNQPQGQRYDTSSFQCHSCNKYGHYLNGCKNKQYDSWKKKCKFYQRKPKSR